MSIAKFHFPSHQAIVEYLGEHALTDNRSSHKPIIIEAAAQALANQTKSSRGIDLAIAFALIDISETFGIPENERLEMVVNLSKTILGCASEN